MTEDPRIDLFTIGVTGRGAESFFETLRASPARTIVDVRRNNSSQLAGFSKKRDLRYLLEQVCGIGYEHRPEWSPEPELLDNFRVGKIDWAEFTMLFNSQLTRSGAAAGLPASVNLDGTCLLCACRDPTRCHRSLVAGLLGERNPGINITHL